MIDPVSAYAAATAAYKGVKMLLQAGKDIEDVSKQLGNFYGAVADITRAESQRKNTTWLEKKQHGEASIEQQAMDITIRAKKLKEFEYDLKVNLDYRFGLGTYDDMLGMRRKIRAERERTVYAAMESKRQIKNNLAITGLALGIVTVLGGGLYLIALAL